MNLIENRLIFMKYSKSMLVGTREFGAFAETAFSDIFKYFEEVIVL